MEQLSFPEASPESLGIPSKALEDFTSALDALDQAHSFVLVRHGRTAAAGAWTPYRSDLPHELFSLSKSFVSVAVGIAQGEGRLSIHDRLADFFPEYLTDDVSPVMRRVTLRDALKMSTGHDRCSFAFVDFEHGDWVKQILESTPAWEPGERFAYNSGATFMLAAVIRKVTGQNVSEYLQPRLFDPLGITPPQWDNSPTGINIGGWGLWLSTQDIAKFAYLLLNKGNLNGRQLIPADYLKEAVSFQSDNSMNGWADWKVGYGYQFWLCRPRNAFRGDGANGQYAVVMPDQDMIFAFHSGLHDMQQVMDHLWDILLPAVHDAPLPEDPAAYQSLLARLNGLTAKIPDEIKKPSAPHPAFECKYALAPNGCGFHELTVSSREDSCMLETDGVRIPAGFGKLIVSEAPLASKTPKRIAAQAAWTDENTLVVYVFCVQTTARFTYELRFEGDFVSVRRSTPVLFFSNKDNILFHGKRIS